MTIPTILLAALIVVESHGNNWAVGDYGQAYGCLQIRHEVIRDVNRIYGTNYSRRDCFDRQQSMAICQLYLSHYASPERLGRHPSMQDYARVWNGGPEGWRKPHTTRYWVKTQQALRR